MSETYMTELEAVNIILSAIGEAPVNSLVGTLPTDVAVADAILNEQRKLIQSLGWYFNSEEQVTLSLDGTGSAVLPANCLKVVPSLTGADLVQRGTRLYDRENHTYVLTVAPIVDITYLLTWDEQPQQLRHYLAVKAARINQQRTIGSRELDGFGAEDELTARAIWAQSDADQAAYNLFNNPSGAKFYQYRRQG